MPIEKLRPDFAFTEDRLKELQQVVPEAFADGKVNWDVLQEALGEHLEAEEQEHFGLTWPGKREARRLAAMASKGTLIPQPGGGVNEENTRNVFVEGENLEVLKLLQKSYAGRVKMIYIDPPYNTGNDFIYSDNFTEPLEAYLRRTGQKEEGGDLLTTNTRAGGRFHSTWLSMMYPRLLLARQLLRDDGVIFVSIDDNEVHHLRKILDEIFGEENIITMFVWEKTQHFGRQKINYYSNVEYVLVYAKNLFKAKDGLRSRLLVERQLEELEDAPLYNASNRETVTRFPPLSTKFNLPDGQYAETTDGKYQLLSAVEVRDGLNINEFSLKFRSRWSERKAHEEFGKGARFWVKTQAFAIRVIYQDDKTSLSSPRQLIFTNSNNPLNSTSRFLEKVGTTEEGSGEVNNLLGIDLEAMYPKPKNLLSYLVSLLYSEDIGFVSDGIVLDFFSGTSTLAHSLLELNLKDGGQRQFIMVQLPEPIPSGSMAFEAGYKTVADIGKERIRRVIEQLTTGPSNGQDLGFRVYSLGVSNFRTWSTTNGSDLPQVEMNFSKATEVLREGWQPTGLLTEVILLQGFPLDSKVEYQEALAKNQVYRVSCEWHDHYLFVCLDDKVDEFTVANLKIRSEDIFICLDTALSDESKVRLADQTNLHVI